MAEKKSTIIFDFDGTIANTLASMVDIVNEHADHFGYKQIAYEEIEQLRDKGSRQILRHLGISIIKLPRIVKTIRAELNHQIPLLETTVNIKDTLKKLKEQNYTLGILTSNSKENVSEFLDKNNLPYFDFIYSGKSVFGKAGLLRHIIKHHKLHKEKMLYVADEIRDINAALKSNVRIACVTWGFNTERALQNKHPDYIVATPEELLDVVNHYFTKKINRL